MPRRPVLRFRRVSCAALLVLSAVASEAGAQSKDAIAKARTEFQEALALETAGDWAGALTRLRSVAQVKMTPQVRFNIAVCEEHLGQLVAALGDFNLASGDAADAKATEVAEKAEEHIRSVTARIPKLTLQRGKGAEAAGITLDGVTLGASMIGNEMKLDPGPHSLSATVRGEQKFASTVTLAEGEVRSLEIVISGPAAPADTSIGTPPADSDGGAPPAKPASSKTAAYVIGGAGAASLVAGVVFIVLRSGTISDLDAVCQSGRCPPSSQSTADKGKLYTGLAEATLLAGAAGVTVGAIMLFGGPSAASTSRAASKPSVWIASGAPGAPLGANLTGSF